MISFREFVTGFALLTSFISGCSEKDKAVCTLQTMEDITRSGVHETTTINRTSANKISGTSLLNWAGNTITHSYTLDDNGNIIKDNAGVIYYKYDKNNLLLESRSGASLGSPGAFVDLIVKTYEYNSSGQLATVTLRSTTFGIPQINYVRYSYDNLYTRNASKETAYDDSSKVLGITSYEYDTKPNAEKGFFPSIEADNNVTKISFDQDPSQNLSYTYQYNDAGYPVKRTSVYNFVRIYSYSNCR